MAVYCLVIPKTIIIDVKNGKLSGDKLSAVPASLLYGIKQAGAGCSEML